MDLGERQVAAVEDVVAEAEDRVERAEVPQVVVRIDDGLFCFTSRMYS